MVNQSLHLIGSLLIACHNAVHLRFQRIRGDIHHGLGGIEFGLEQLSVLVILLGLLHNLLQHLVLSLGQIFLFSL